MGNRSALGTADVVLPRLAILFFLFVLFSSEDTTVRAQAGVPFEKSGGMMIVQVFINGHGPFRFVVDTGSSACLVDESLARELALTPVSRVKMMSAAGITEAPAYQIGNLKLGDFVALNVRAVSVSGNATMLSSRRARGVLGLSFLNRFNFLVDYKGGSVVFEPGISEDSPNDGVYPMDCSQGLYVVLLPVGDDAARFAIDSGTDDILLFSGAHIPVARDFFESSVRTTYGERKVTRAEISGLRIGKMVLNKQKVMILNGEGPGDCDGLLPASLFPSLYFENRRNRLVISPVHGGHSSRQAPDEVPFGPRQ